MNKNTLQVLKNLNPKVRSKYNELEQNHYVKEGKLYSLDGEFLGDKYTPTLNINGIRNNLVSKELLQDHEKENGGFVFLFFKIGVAIKERVPTLSKPDISRLLYLLTFVDYKNRLTTKNNHPIHKKDLSKLLRLSPKRSNEFIKKLTESNILIANESNELFIGEWIAATGTINQKELKRNSSSYIRMFRKTVQSLFENTESKDLGRLSMIYIVLPCLNLATNIISVNPDESDMNKVKPMKLIELTEMLEYKDYKTLKASLNKIKIGKDYAFGFVEFEGDRRTMRIIVNPKIVFAGNYEQLQVIKALFN